MSADCTIPADQCPRMSLRSSAPLMRHELRRFNLSDRERTLAGVILSLSWEEGLANVRLNKLEDLEHLTGLKANHICETLHALINLMRVVIKEEAADGIRYSINPHSENWQAKPRTSKATMLSTINLIREINGVPRQTEDQVNFKMQSVTHFFDQKTPVLRAIPKEETPL